jgi:hypothetical protein
MADDILAAAVAAGMQVASDAQASAALEAMHESIDLVVADPARGMQLVQALRRVRSRHGDSNCPLAAL